MRFQLVAALLAGVLGLVGCSRGSRQAKPAVSVEGCETVAEALCANGFEQVAERVLALRTASVVLERREGQPGPEPGSSRIGGTPDLPKGAAWPQSDGKSLSFVAQINLGEIAGVWAESPLPRSGTLHFFYDAEQSAWGFDPKDKGRWAVLYSPDPPAQLHSTAFPADLPEHARFKPKAVAPVLREDDPDYFQIDPGSFSLSEADDDRVFRIFEAFADDAAAIHKLFGLPDQIQGDMQTECQLAFHGLYCGDATGYNDPRAKQLRAGASQWRLLLQIDTDDDARMMWGDTGRLYYWMREEDLAARAFDNSWLILQCY